MKNILIPVFILALTSGSLTAQIQNPDSSIVTIATDSTNYFFNGYVTLVRFTIHNSGDSTLYFPHCCDYFDYYIDAKENGLWINKGGYGVVCIASCSMGTKLLNRDSSYADVAKISKPGIYRLIFPFGRRNDNHFRDSLITNEFLIQDHGVTKVEVVQEIEPSTFWLGQNFPNPFNPTTQVRFSIPQGSQVTLVVIDVLGRILFKIVDEAKPRGVYQVTFSANGVPNGTYFLRLQAGEYTQTQKIILAK